MNQVLVDVSKRSASQLRESFLKEEEHSIRKRKVLDLLVKKHPSATQVIPIPGSSLSPVWSDPKLDSAKLKTQVFLKKEWAVSYAAYKEYKVGEETLRVYGPIKGLTGTQAARLLIALLKRGSVEADKVLKIPENLVPENLIVGR